MLRKLDAGNLHELESDAVDKALNGVAWLRYLTFRVSADSQPHQRAPDISNPSTGIQALFAAIPYQPCHLISHKSVVYQLRKQDA